MFSVLERLTDFASARRSSFRVRLPLTDRLEDTHREQLASHKRQWAADAEAQAQVTRKALDEDLEETRARHARELSRLERDLVDAKAHLAEASRQAEEVRETANVEKYDLESRLAGLKQAVVHQQALLQQAEETTRKVAEPVHSHEECEATLARVLSELKDERKHVAEMECQLKKARNEDARPRPKESDGSQSNTVLLKEKLDTATRENEELSKEVQRLTPLVPEGRHGVGEFTDCREAKEEGEGQAETDLCSLRKALEEADLKLSHFQQLRDGAEQVCLRRSPRNMYGRHVGNSHSSTGRVWRLTRPNPPYFSTPTQIGKYGCIPKLIEYQPMAKP